MNWIYVVYICSAALSAGDCNTRTADDWYTVLSASSEAVCYKLGGRAHYKMTLYEPPDGKRFVMRCERPLPGEPA